MLDPLELAGFTLALAMVVCNAKQIHWGWPLAIASSVLYIWIFANAKLYGDAALQVLFIAMSLWGWWQWRRGVSAKALVPKPINRAQAAWVLVSWVALWLLLTWLLGRFTDSDVALADACITAGSVVATLLLARKFTLNWLLWLVVNTVSTLLFIHKQMWPSAVLYSVLAVMSVYGWRQWQRVQHA